MPNIRPRVIGFSAELSRSKQRFGSPLQEFALLTRYKELAPSVGGYDEENRYGLPVALFKHCFY